MSYMRSRVDVGDIEYMSAWSDNRDVNGVSN